MAEGAALNPIYITHVVVTTPCSTVKITSPLYGLLSASAKNILRITFESNNKSVLFPEQKHIYIVAISPCDLQQQNIHEAAAI